MAAKRRASRIGVVGLGYVGLPLAVEFGKQYETVGFDVNPKRVAQLRRGRDLTRLTGQARQLRIQERDVERRVVDHELRAAQEGEQLLGDVRKARLPVQVGARDAVHRERAVLDLALGIQVAVEGAPRGPPVQQLHAADLDDTVIELGLEACGLGVQNDLSHW